MTDAELESTVQLGTKYGRVHVVVRGDEAYVTGGQEVPGHSTVDLGLFIVYGVPYRFSLHLEYEKAADRWYPPRNGYKGGLAMYRVDSPFGIGAPTDKAYSAVRNYVTQVVSDNLATMPDVVAAGRAALCEEVVRRCQKEVDTAKDLLRETEEALGAAEANLNDAVKKWKGMTLLPPYD